MICLDGYNYYTTKYEYFKKNVIPTSSKNYLEFVNIIVMDTNFSHLKFVHMIQKHWKEKSVVWLT